MNLAISSARRLCIAVMSRKSMVGLYLLDEVVAENPIVGVVHLPVRYQHFRRRLPASATACPSIRSSCQ